jgi:hypothetical protein
MVTVNATSARTTSLRRRPPLDGCDPNGPPPPLQPDDGEPNGLDTGGGSGKTGISSPNDSATSRTAALNRDPTRVAIDRVCITTFDCALKVAVPFGHVDGLHLIDLETACLGPIEWDLASPPMTVAAHFDHLDLALLKSLRILNGIRVATWWRRVAHREVVSR